MPDGSSPLVLTVVCAGMRKRFLLVSRLEFMRE